MASKDEAQQLAAELLGIIAIGQSIESPHDTRMEEAYNEVYAELQVLALPVWATTEEMPDEVTPHFVGLMAHNKLNLYSVSDSRYQRIINQTGANGERAKSNIKSLLRDSYEDLNEATDY